MPEPDDAPAPAGNAWRWLALTAGLMALVAAGYGHTTGGFFLGDDFNAVYAASRTTNLSEALDLRGSFRLGLIREAFPDFEAQSTLVRPLPTLTLWFDYLRYGRDPTGYHVTSLVVHAGNALLAAVLAFMLVRRFAAAAIAGAAFALHPSHPEAVVWIAARADVLVALATGVTLAAWLSYLSSGRRAALCLACVGLAVGLAAKEMAAAVPGVALALAPAARGTERWRRCVIGAAALGAVVAAYLGLRLAFVGSLQSYHQPTGGIAAQLLRFVGDAIAAAVWPGDRVAHADPDGLRAGHAAAALALCLLGAHAWRRWLPAVAACATAFVVSLAPVMTWGGIGASGEGTRLVYPSLLLVAIALGAAGAHATARRPVLAWSAVTALVATAMFGLWRSLEPWQGAARTMQQVVQGLRDVARDKQALVLCDDVPGQNGPAYLAQNAFPAAVWLFVRPRLRVEMLRRPQWDAAVVEHRRTLESEPTLAALRFDAAQGRWVGPDGR